ncbi:hypothetical protein [Stenotrophomonas muris]|uniref:hypothetical protein n=1 Tax=Stenotrophomonas muris TaxID=2963283 RepID=UPI00320B4805
MSETELKARELLVAEFERDGLVCHAQHIRNGEMVYLDDGRALRAVIAALSPQWQPISTAPKHGQPVLLDHPDWHSRVMRGGWDAHELAWRVHGFGCPATQPTKWHPLPAPPEVEG